MIVTENGRETEKIPGNYQPQSIDRLGKNTRPAQFEEEEIRPIVG